MFVTFFPHLVAGPIVRPTQLVPQFEAPRQATRDQVLWGLGLLILGLFEKVVIADGGLASAADAVFGAPGPVGFADAWLGTLAFSGQIFCDFAGYSTAAVGAALCLGFALPDNFRMPYAAIGFSDFWRRWHISLSTWLRDYLYIPLGGNRGTRSAHLRQPDADHAARRPLARRELDLRRVGRPARPLPCGRTLGPLAHAASPAIRRAPGTGWRSRCSRISSSTSPGCSSASTTFDGAAHILAGMFGLAPDADPVLPTIYMIKVAVIVASILVVQWLMRNVTLEDDRRARALVGSPAWSRLRCSSP